MQIIYYARSVRYGFFYYCYHYILLLCQGNENFYFNRFIKMYTIDDLSMTHLLFRSMLLPQSNTIPIYCIVRIVFCLVQINRQVDLWTLGNDKK